MASGRGLNLPEAEADPSQPTGPTVKRMALGTQLRRLREASGITREVAGYSIRASDAKISRMELGRVSFKERDVADLLTLYGIHDDPDRLVFLELVRQANSPGWWQEFGDVLPGWFETYLGLEQAASVIRTHEVQFVPGLLQVEEYAGAVVRLGLPDASADEVERRAGLRRRRQAVLTQDGAPRLWAVLDETALRRPVGGRGVLGAQLRHLLELNERPNVTIQVLLHQSGGNAAVGGPFTILRFAEPDLPDIVYLEQLTSALYLDKRADTDRYATVMNRLAVEAASPEATLHLLRELVRRH